MNNPDLYNESNQATYCPEDDKLRLYVGRVPRDEYEALRAEGWTSTPKQDCDFVAVWTPQREDTALSYAGIILDEDQGPEDRAADRAERFGGYLDKRLSEATGHADRYDAGPNAHGFQSQARAERAAERHDRIATRAVNAWEKAEYWQRRTAGVISNALYKSSPSVRMGRIKTLEAEKRQIEANYTPHKDTPRDGGKSYGYEEHHTLVGQGRAVHFVKTANLDKIRQSYARSLEHVTLRLAYENQMLEAQGGRAASVEMEKGGKIGGRVIAKVNKSTKTGRVVSVAVIGPRVEGWAYQVSNEPGTEYALYTIETERLPENAYTEPTDESLAILAAFEEQKKQAAAERKAKTPACPLVNPTDEDAERLQTLLNERAKAIHCESNIRRYGRDYAEDFKPSTVCRITQQVYSKVSKGAYARAETRGICKGGEMEPRESNCYRVGEKEARERRGPALCQVRSTGSDGSDYGARRVIVLTDKPQKPLPVAVWNVLEPEAPKEETPKESTPALSPMIAGAMAALEILTQGDLFA